jgi:hypothetical protein
VSIDLSVGGSGPGDEPATPGGPASGGPDAPATDGGAIAARPAPASCRDFATWEEAHRYYQANGGLAGAAQLDADGDGIACEELLARR